MRIALIGSECEESLALRYLAGALEHDHHDVILIPYNTAESTARAARELALSGAELAGFSMVFTYRAREFADVAIQARQLGFTGHITAGGHFAAFNAESLLRDVPAFDSIAIGEGEQILQSLALNISAPGRVNGLVWRNTDVTITRNPPASPQTLDDLPFPTRKQPADKYLNLPIANMLSSRGCTHSCAFCSISAWHKLCGGARFRMRSPENVAIEMAQLYWRGYRIFNFHDDNFFLPNRNDMIERMRTLQQCLTNSGVGKIAFAAKCRPDSIDEELLTILKSMGLFRLFIGIEAGTADALKNLGRGQTRTDNERALEMVNAQDIHACFNLLLMNPNSTLDDIRANVAFLRANPRNPMNFCRTEIYSGTPLEKRLRESRRLTGSYWGYGYRMTDDGAQRVFELIRDALWERHQSDDNIQHLAMRLDYEYQLLAHFFGAKPALRSRVKQFICNVNLNTCDYLDEVIASAGQAFSSDKIRSDYVRDLTKRIDHDNMKFTAVGLTILADIRHAAGAWQNPHKAWSKRAASAGLAATLTLAGVRESVAQNSHTTERIAVPAKVDQVAEKPTQEKPKQPPDGKVATIAPYFQPVALPNIASMIQPAQDVEVELWLDKNGKVTFAAIYKGNVEKIAVKELTEADKEKADKMIADLGDKEFKKRDDATKELTALGPAILQQVKAAMAKTQDPEVIERCKKIIDKLDNTLNVPQTWIILSYLRSLSFQASEVKGKRFVIPVSKGEIENYNGQGFNTHICEMIAPMGE